MRTKLIGWTLGVVLMTLGTSAAAAAQERSDTQIANDISAQINRYAQFTIFDYVTGSVDNGVVTLTGKVTMPFKKDDIGRKAGEIAGVREVQNHLRVQPQDQFSGRSASSQSASGTGRQDSFSKSQDSSSQSGSKSKSTERE